MKGSKPDPEGTITPEMFRRLLKIRVDLEKMKLKQKLKRMEQTENKG